MQPLTFITLSKDQETSLELKTALQGSGRARLLTACDGAEQLLNEVTRLRPSATLFHVTTATADKDFAFIKQLLAKNPNTAVITASSEAVPSLILGSLRAGAREFLQLPVVPDEFRTVMDRVVEFSSKLESSTSKRAHFVATFSGKGGSGVSFLATNLAAAMPESTLIIDLNLQTGDVASFLGLDVRYSISDFVRNRVRLDDALMTSLVTPYSNNLTVLAAPLEAHEAEDVKPQDLAEILYLLGQRYDHIILDLPHTFDPVTVAALDLVDDIFLVLTLDIPGIRSTKRALKVFDNLGYPRQKIRAIVNRWSKNIDGELQKVESHLGERLIGFVPNDYRRVMDSINLGRPLVQSDPTSKIALEIKRIAALITDKSTQFSLPRKKLLRSIFGGKGSTAALEFSAVTDNA
ncbi:MAG TPA: AAA family ATPase [Pyrinomonadaceae bacterium]|jgi:pilus assembly protein CpaE|nr:AAA family ATPase [Pyrinomonadaceae bacterium]